MQNVLLVAYLLIVLALIAVILLQRSEGGGLGMGGNAGGLMTVRGSANLLTRTTGVLAALFFATAIGIFLGTVARSMPQLGLLYMLVVIPMNMLSGSNTPLESMPPFLRTVMQASPSTHFVSFAQAILYRGAGFDTVWPQFLAVAMIGGLFLGLALLRFRRVTAQAT